MKDEIDERRIEALMTAFLEPIKAHFERGPQARARTFEVLNALAACTAVILSGTDRAGLDFFNEALCNHLPDKMKDR